MTLKLKTVRSNLRQCAVDFIFRCRHLFQNPDSRFAARAEGMTGIEIGGPSKVFYRRVPIYQRAKQIDGVNFSNYTVWEGSISAGKSFRYWRNKIGLQIIDEAGQLDSLKSETYDFLLSSNCLEHVANPIKALFQWNRVIKTSGFAVVIVPRKESNFDHKRMDTTFQHLLDDYENSVGEDDLSHLPEILAMHDLGLDPGALDLENFHKRSLQNLTNRCLHHHVFSLAVLTQSAEHCGFAIEDARSTKRDHWVFLKKLKSLEPQ
jgi:SAM-dependent methyltransferase